MFFLRFCQRSRVQLNHTCTANPRLFLTLALASHRQYSTSTSSPNLSILTRRRIRSRNVSLACRRGNSNKINSTSEGKQARWRAWRRGGTALFICSYDPSICHRTRGAIRTSLEPGRELSPSSIYNKCPERKKRKNKFPRSGPR